MGKSILVFIDGVFYKQIGYRTKFLAKKNYAIFKKYGIMNPNDGLPINGATFELL